MSYSDVYQHWLDDPTGFWETAAEDIDWYNKWDTILDDSAKPIYRWFKGASVNTCYNALDRHVENGRADQLALIYDSPITDTIRSRVCAESCWNIKPAKRRMMNFFILWDLEKVLCQIVEFEITMVA